MWVARYSAPSAGLTPRPCTCTTSLSSETARWSVTTTSPSPSTTAPTAIAVRLDHYAIEPDTLESAAGSVTLAANNIDGVPHDLTLIRTALAADQLPITGIRIDETSPDIEILGRTPRLAPGESGSFTTSLAAGVYLLVCTVPHHFVREAMVATLTIV